MIVIVLRFFKFFIEARGWTPLIFVRKTSQKCLLTK